MNESVGMTVSDLEIISQECGPDTPILIAIGKNPDPEGDRSILLSNIECATIGPGSEVIKVDDKEESGKSKVIILIPSVNRLADLLDTTVEQISDKFSKIINIKETDNVNTEPS